MKKDLRIKIASYVIASAIAFINTYCFMFTSVAFAADDDCPFPVSNVAPANIDTWQSAPTNLRKLGEAFVSTLRSESGSDFFVGIIDDIPTSMAKVITDSALLYPFCIEPYDDVYYYLDNDGNLKIYDPFMRSGRSGSGGINRFVSSSEDFVFNSKFFKDKVNYWGQYYSPKNTSSRLSWQTDVLSSNNPQQLGFFQEGSFAYNTDWHECYFIPFYYSGTSDNKYYYSQFQYHFYQKVDKAEDGSNIISLYVDVWNWYDNTEPSSFLITDKLATYRFGRWDFFYYHNTFLFCPLKSDYINASNVLSPRVSLPDSSDLYDFTDSSLSSTIASSNVINYNRILGQKATPESIVTANHADYGFYVSDSAINMGDYGIDTSRIPDNYIINYGDTVYNYTITNPSTGKSDTINNYITNNYIISGDDQGSSGGDTINNWNISFGDFLIDIGNTIQTSITAVFVPSDVVLENYQTKLSDTINLKLPFINDIGTILDSLFVDIRDGNIIYSSDASTYAASDDGSSAEDEDEEDSPPPDLVDGNSDLYIYPKWKINLSFFGQDMELTILDFSMYADVLFYVRIVVAAFVYIAYFVNIYRYLPVLIGGVGDMTNTVLTLSSRSSKKGDDD